MTEPDNAEAAERPEAKRPSKRFASWWPVAAPTIALLVGLVLGGVVVGVANNGDAPTANGDPSSPSDGNATEAPADSPTTVVVPAECLAAVDTVDQLTELIQQGVGAIRDFQPQQLRELLTELERLDSQARQQAKACRAVRVEQSPDP